MNEETKNQTAEENAAETADSVTQKETAGESATKESAAERVGIDYAVKLSYTAIDRSDLPDKRDLLYGLVCFGCMFDERFATDPDPIVKKYDCLHLPEPNKPDLYRLAYTVASLPGKDATAAGELKAAWFQMFAYVLLSEAPHDEALYKKIVALLQTTDVYETVLASRFSVYIPATAEELTAQGAPARLVEWYAPYLRYCAERDDKGVTRETTACKKLLARGQFKDALLRCERLLAAFPDDSEIAVTDVAARVSLSGVATPQQRTALLQETLSLIDEYIDRSPAQYFRYYRGLTLLGLMDTVGARAEFTRCLENDPQFELAALMLKGMDKYQK